MALTRILLWLGNSFVLCAVMMALTALSAVVLLEFGEALRFAFLTVMIGVVGTLFIFTTRNTPARESNSDALAFLLLFWLIMPVLFALPYVVSQATPSFATAYFEAVSAVTTTGASTLEADELSATLLIWRSFGRAVRAAYWYWTDCFRCLFRAFSAVFYRSYHYRHARI